MFIRYVFYEYTFLEVTPNGQIVQEWSVAQLLQENGLTGLLYLGSLNNESTQLNKMADPLHLNDVEPFPLAMTEGFFKHGDIMISLRNINTVLIFNRQNRKIKFICTGWFIRQHDPDFMDGNTFSVFDNNNMMAAEPHSRIRIVSAINKSTQVFFEGNTQTPFFSNIMGKHQWLPNGNLLITESRQGRAFEINRQKKVVWEYRNVIDDGLVGLVEDVQRLPKKDWIIDSKEERKK